MPPLYRDRDWLYEEYYERGRTLQEIADELGVDHTTISKWRRRLNIPKPSQEVELECPVCESVFTTQRNRVKRAKHTNVCSRDCLYEARERGLLSWRDNIINRDARDMGAIPDESVDLVVTSPPYHVNGFTGRDDYSDYDDSKGIEEWEELMRKVLEEVFRVTKPDAKVCLVLGTAKPDDERTHQHRLAAHAYMLAKEVGFDYWDGIVWKKRTYANSGGRDRPLFGSYPYPSNFLVNQNHEQILVFRKWVSEEYHAKRNLPEMDTPERDESKLSTEEWREYAQSMWDVDPVKEGVHPAQFPVEIPSRLIRLFSFQGDTVLDPFCGSGTTAVASIRNKRHYCGYEISEDYCRIARERVLGEDN